MATGNRQREARQAEAILAMRQSFASFFAAFEPERPYIYGRHTNVLLRECQAASDALDRGECHYVVITLPPRHGKSDIFSRRYPVWHLCSHPEHELILGSYSAELSQELSMDGLKCFKQAAPYFGLRPGIQRQNFWTVGNHKGRLSAVGLGGSITGRGAHIFVIDDYLKNRQEAESKTVRDHLWDSFKSDLWTRRAPVHAFIIVATRWHTDDLVGRILREHQENPDFPAFRVVHFPAQAEDGSYLFPERFKAAHYESQKALGLYVWHSLYQGKPTPREGGMFKTAFVEIEQTPPTMARIVRYWDKAGTSKGGCFTVGLKMGIDRNDPPRFWVLDVTRGQWDASERERIIKQTAGMDGTSVTVAVEQEPGSGGKESAQGTIRRLAGYVVMADRPQGDKELRADPFAVQVNGGNVLLKRADWNQTYLDELNDFPHGVNKDQVDASSGAFAMLTTQKVVGGIV